MHQLMAGDLWRRSKVWFRERRLDDGMWPPRIWTRGLLWLPLSLGPKIAGKILEFQGNRWADNASSFGSFAGNFNSKICLPWSPRWLLRLAISQKGLDPRATYLASKNGSWSCGKTMFDRFFFRSSRSLDSPCWEPWFFGPSQLCVFATRNGRSWWEVAHGHLMTYLCGGS